MALQVNDCGALLLTENHVGPQALVPRLIFAYRDYRLLYGWMLAEHGFDLA